MGPRLALHPRADQKRRVSGLGFRGLGFRGFGFRIRVLYNGVAASELYASGFSQAAGI